MTDFEIHPCLLSDCHRLGRLGACHLLLHRNASLPWFILVPETAVTDLLDLDPKVREAVLDACAQVCAYIKAEFRLPKVNFAAIGNLVPQLHLHLVGRTPGDPCWPAPVWGNLDAGPEYPPEQIDAITAALSARVGLVPINSVGTVGSLVDRSGTDTAPDGYNPARRDPTPNASQNSPPGALP
jgi:diadenosine tetraphosphate (Ap4A) HIT family hydrolase